MSRLVSLSDKAYTTLLKMKKGKESFSDVVLKLAEKKKKRSLLEFAGKWKNNEEMVKIMEDVLRERHAIKYREKDAAW